MKIMYVNLLKNKKKNEEVLMKDLRNKDVHDFFDELRHKNARNIENIHKNKFFNKLKNFSNNNIVKKNELTLFVLSLMLVTSAYMNYTNKIKKRKMAQIGDAKFVSTSISGNQNETTNISGETNLTNEKQAAQESHTKEENTLMENSIQTNAKDLNEQNKSLENSKNVDEQIQPASNNDEKISTDDYFSTVRIERDKSYSQMLESYTNILKDTNVPNDQKSIATNEIKKINDRKNQISTIENLLKGKDIEDSVILINDNSIDAIIKSSTELSKKTVAQIENIISRELNANIQDIHISTHN